MGTGRISRALGRFTVALALTAGIAGCDRSSPTAPEGVRVGEADGVRDFGSVLQPDDFLVDAGFAPDGSLWVLSFRGDVFRESGGTAVRYPLALPAGEVGRDLFVAADGRVWVTSTGAYGELRDGRWSRRTTAGSAPLVPPVSAIAVAPSGDLLIGAGNAIEGGLWLRRGEEWISFTPGNSELTGTITNDLVVGPDGSFWVASGGAGGRGGVGRVRDGSFESFLTGQASGLLYPSPDRLAVDDERLIIASDVTYVDTPGPDGGLQTHDFATGRIDSIFPDRTDRVSSRVRAVTLTPQGVPWFTLSLDEAQPTCPNCLSGVARLEGSEVIVSPSERYGLAPNEFLPQIVHDAAGRVHLVTESRVVPVEAESGD